MTLADILTKLYDGGARFMLDISGDGYYRANLGNATEVIVENAALTDIGGVEAFFREQAAIHFPEIVLDIGF